MKLSILDIHITELSQTPLNENFRSLTHHIRELFIYLQPRPRLEINGSSKITLCFGKQGNEVLWNNVLGCSNIFIEDFNFIKFYELNRKEQDVLILNQINIGLKKIATNNDVHKLIDETTQKIISSNFEILIPIKKLSKTTKDRKIKISIYRALSPKNGEIWICNIFNKKTKIEKELLVTKKPDYLDRTNLYSKSIIQRNIYKVLTKLNKVVFEINIIDKAAANKDKGCTSL